MNTQDEIKTLKQRISELEQQAKQAKQEQEFPQVEDDYWCVDNDAEVLGVVWYGDDYDQGRLSINNVFETKEEAEFIAEKLKVEAELRKFSEPWSLEKTQYTFSFNWEHGAFEVEFPDYNQYHSCYYFDSANALRSAFETVGVERIKKYLFGVED